MYITHQTPNMGRIIQHNSFAIFAILFQHINTSRKRGLLTNQPKPIDRPTYWPTNGQEGLLIRNTYSKKMRKSSNDQCHAQFQQSFEKGWHVPSWICGRLMRRNCCASILPFFRLLGFVLVSFIFLILWFWKRHHKRGWWKQRWNLLVILGDM